VAVGLRSQQSGLRVRPSGKRTSPVICPLPSSSLLTSRHQQPIIRPLPGLHQISEVCKCLYQVGVLHAGQHRHLHGMSRSLDLRVVSVHHLWREGGRVEAAQRSDSSVLAARKYSFAHDSSPCRLQQQATHLDCNRLGVPAPLVDSGMATGSQRLVVDRQILHIAGWLQLRLLQLMERAG